MATSPLGVERFGWGRN